MSNANQAEKIVNLNLIKLTGKDSASFLQGQFTNDINNLSNSWQFSGYCSPKGRLLALLLLWKDDNAIYGLLDSSVCGTVVKRLRMYVLRSEVTIEVIESAAFVGRFNADNKPRFSLEVSTNSHTLNFGGRQLQVFPTGETGLLSETNNWAEANINDGLPVINSETSELFVPQMVNLDLLDGINFKKGCYTGQEIVARMHYLGKLKQRMYVCEVNCSARAGDKVLINGRNAGTIVCVADCAANLGDQPKPAPALAVLRTALLEQNPVFMLENGAKLKPRPSQPYLIP